MCFLSVLFLAPLKNKTKNYPIRLLMHFLNLPEFIRPVDFQSARDGSGRVNDGGNEEGLLGLAFHSDFETNNYFFVNYTATNPRRTVISRFQLNPNDASVADSTSEFVILEIAQPYSNHNGGQITFGACSI